MKTEDYPQVREIYEQGIRTGIATFDNVSSDWEKWNIKHIEKCRLVSEENNEITGWAALTKFSDKAAYSGVCELSVYVHEDHRGKGVGKALLKALIDESEKNNIWSLIALIIKENESSINLHYDCGFRKVGFYEKPGKYSGRWRDVIILERRSRVIGSD